MNTPQERPHRAEYLVLLHKDAHQRTLLFNDEHHFLTELDDDWFTVDHFVRADMPCPPRPSSDIARDPAGDFDGQLECVSLG